MSQRRVFPGDVNVSIITRLIRPNCVMYVVYTIIMLSLASPSQCKHVKRIRYAMGSISRTKRSLEKVN